jgi:hypothetical protein
MDPLLPDQHPSDSEHIEGMAPAPEPAGQLTPPPRKPPTAVASFVSGPEPRPPRSVQPWGRKPRESPLVGAVNAALDVLDAIGDAVRAAAARVAS